MIDRRFDYIRNQILFDTLKTKLILEEVAKLPRTTDTKDTFAPLSYGVLMDEKPLITAKELEELFGKVDFQQLVKDELVAEIKAELKKHEDKYLTDIIIHPEVYKYLTRKQYKKIKRRIFYEVIWWSAESRLTKCFYSVKKMRKFVNEIHRWYKYNDYIEIEKTFCYRDFTPRHKWYYISFEPNQFVCVEKW